MKTISANEVASYFIELASQNDENDLTNLKLQKLLYFSQAEYYLKNNKSLFSDEIEAWDYGPVVPNVYHKYKSCGSFPITVFDNWEKTNALSTEIIKFVEAIWEKWGKFSASYLVEITHKKDSPWKKYYKSGNCVIPVTELRI
jgi:uncharacterized phage-associated protein